MIILFFEAYLDCTYYRARRTIMARVIRFISS